MLDTPKVPNETFDPVAYINTPRFATWNFGLTRIEKLLEYLGNPQEALKFVHVAGTNGKGSTCAYLASILQAAGYKTGLFTSPYIETFEERIRINGENIPLDDLREITEAVRDAAARVEQEVGEHPTEFELMTAVALEYFYRQQCDIVVLEVGLGGRLDSTNIIPTSEVSVIARIGLDHTNVLGKTLAEIASEKAGIIRAHGTVVNYPQAPEAEAVILAEAARQQATIAEPDFAALQVGEPHVIDVAQVSETLQVSGVLGAEVINEPSTASPLNADQTPDSMHVSSDKSEPPASTLVRPFAYRGQQYVTQLLGSYQPTNAALALEAIERLREKGWQISSKAAKNGIARTTWPGRFEVLSAAEGKPAVVVDGGHNPQGAEALRESLQEVFPGRPVIFIMAALADKDLPSMIAAVAPLAKAFITVTAPSPRAASAEDLAALIDAEINASHIETCEMQAPCISSDCERGDREIYSAANYSEAVQRARSLSTSNDIICAFGSLYAVTDAKHALRQELQ